MRLGFPERIYPRPRFSRPALCRSLRQTVAVRIGSPDNLVRADGGHAAFHQSARRTAPDGVHEDIGVFACYPVIARFVHRAEMSHENGSVEIAPRDFADLGELVVLAESVEENWKAPLVSPFLSEDSLSATPPAHGGAS